jgi:hypothetical protein
MNTHLDRNRPTRTDTRTTTGRHTHGRHTAPTHHTRNTIAAVLAITAGLTIGALTTPADATAPTHTPPCATEDGSGGPLPCYWNAGTAGNGIGESFTVHPDGPTTTNGTPVTYVYDNGTITHGNI